jgi:hypothetical protein
MGCNYKPIIDNKYLQLQLKKEIKKEGNISTKPSFETILNAYKDMFLREETNM